ncbi:MAG: Asp23/Gls24 family envelope stress response protein [Clostridia bacterium]|nr:Asp23/Gls24 family envelope stress response protein [Clostridia bacterium]
MDVVGFVGVSGSGKSYRAAEVAAENNIKYIIDDGLLITEGRIIAGKSAKKEGTKLASVRRALFYDDEHTQDVKDAIKSENPSGILVLGTSHSMIKKIADALEIGEVKRFIEINDVATETEIESAINIRRSQGKHVIPVPTFEIKKSFSGYWKDSLKKIVHSSKEEDVIEKSVVRPTFSYMGEYEISNSVLVSICKQAAHTVEGVTAVPASVITEASDGIDVRVDIAVKYGIKLQPVGREVIKRVTEAVENTTSINVNFVTVKIKALDIIQ